MQRDKGRLTFGRLEWISQQHLHRVCIQQVGIPIHERQGDVAIL